MYQGWSWSSLSGCLRSRVASNSPNHPNSQSLLPCYRISTGSLGWPVHWVPVWLWYYCGRGRQTWGHSTYRVLRSCQSNFNWARGLLICLGLRVPACGQRYLDGCDAAIDEREWLESLEAVHDLHGAEVLQHELYAFNLVHFLPDIVFEAVHSFLGGAGGTMMSRRAESDFLTDCFSRYFYFSSFGTYIQIL